MEQLQQLLILGAGGFGNVVRELAQATGGFGRIAFLDDASPQALGPCAQYTDRALRAQYAVAYPAFGDNALRMRWLQRLLQAGYRVPVLVHPRAYVSPSAVLGAGSVVLPLAAVNARCTVGEGCIINLGALLDHDCVLESGVHLAPGAVIKAGNTVAACEKVESGAVLARPQT